MSVRHMRRAVATVGRPGAAPPLALFEANLVLATFYISGDPSLRSAEDNARHLDRLRHAADAFLGFAPADDVAPLLAAARAYAANPQAGGGRARMDAARVAFLLARAPAAGANPRGPGGPAFRPLPYLDND